jgi:hypothetical protein
VIYKFYYYGTNYINGPKHRNPKHLTPNYDTPKKEYPKSWIPQKGVTPKKLKSCYANFFGQAQKTELYKSAL